MLNCDRKGTYCLQVRGDDNIKSDEFIKQLKMAGFNVISSNYSPEFFGNGVVSLLLENGYHILCIKDRGIYECVFEYKNKLRRVGNNL